LSEADLRSFEKPLKGSILVLPGLNWQLELNIRQNARTTYPIGTREAGSKRKLPKSCQHCPVLLFVLVRRVQQ
jgi:hypothetical protein